MPLLAAASLPNRQVARHFSALSTYRYCVADPHRAGCVTPPASLIAGYAAAMTKNSRPKRLDALNLVRTARFPQKHLRPRQGQQSSNCWNCDTSTSAMLIPSR